MVIVGDFEYGGAVVHGIIDEQSHGRKGKLYVVGDVLNDGSGERLRD